ncbi:hypothetical protein LRP67_07230 [Nocardioides sp. cx-169]|uniref:hypothetical protein n=1 Tax=Nocardioides sp. cx-169 TaxID=2899080 RepID=UPI001E56FF52|nr:hypothetical protein [Nocardioides sp. cx-169]MCD4533870.1 hypothetical protein [Nocardioides sp. cx-169]
MNDDELRQRLQAGDPASDLPPADPARVARLLEDTMNADLDEPADDGQHEQHEPQESRETGTRNRSPLTWLVAAAAVLLAAVGVFALLGNDPESDDVPSAAPSSSASQPPTVTELMAPPPTSARCMVPNAETLATAQVAFSGTVESVAADSVRLAPDRFYAGEPTDLVEVSSPPELMTALVGAVKFEEGRRYLISANGGQVAVCGFSGPFSPQLEALYVEAFPG